MKTESEIDMLREKYGQCNKCGEYYPAEQMSEPDEVSYYALCKNCYEMYKDKARMIND